jgi:hypothetical protein
MQLPALLRIIKVFHVTTNSPTIGDSEKREEE